MTSVLRTLSIASVIAVGVIAAGPREACAQSSSTPLVGPQDGSTYSPTAGDTTPLYRSLRPNRPLLIIGTLALVGGYVPTAVIGGTSVRDTDRNLFVPVVGPWLNLADRQCEGCPDQTTTTMLLVGSGVLQGAGALLLISSFVLPQRVEVARIAAGPVRLQLSPTTYGRGGYGLGAFGEF